MNLGSIIGAIACYVAVVVCGGSAITNGDTQEQDSITRNHIKVYDTVRETRDTTDVYAGVPTEYLSESQFRIWAKRKGQMKQWQKQYAALHLPLAAKIIDVRPFTTAHGTRTILAWMTDMETHVQWGDDLYTCPEVTIGRGYFYGRLHLSLVNDAQHKIINSIRIYDIDLYDKGDTVVYYESCEFLNYPFAIANPKYRSALGGLIYYATGGTDSTEAEADILHFVDLNADGKKYELALFNQSSCVGKNSTLMGYNEQKDSLIWYDWAIDWKATGVDGKDSAYSTTEHWINEAMTSSFDKKGEMNYEFDYRGRGGSVMRYYLRYDNVKDKYSGIIDYRELPEDTLSQPSWMPEGRKL